MINTYHQIWSLLIILPWQNLGLIEETKISRPLPWRRPANVFRVKEDVRPIFWYAIQLLSPPPPTQRKKTETRKQKRI